MVRTLLQDLRYALRLMGKNPGFTAIAITTLALGIGATTAIFSLVYGVMLRPLPYPRADRIVMVKPTFPGGRNDQTTGPKYLFWRERQHSFDAVASYGGAAGANLQTSDHPERILVRPVTAEFFRVLRMRPLAGRDFASGDDEPGRAGVAMIGYGFWQRRYGGADVLGRGLTLGSSAYTVIGIAARGIGAELAADVFVPLVVRGNPMSGGLNFPVLARLKDGISLARADANMRVVAAECRAEHPSGMRPGEMAGVYAYQGEVVREVRPSLLILLSAVALVLLIACANVANLQLARVAGRKREIALRLAIGAGQWRVARQLLTESVCLSLAGAALGLALAQAAVGAVVRFRPVALPRLDDVDVDWRVLMFTIGVAFSVGVLFGLAPALEALRADLRTAIEEGGRGASGARSGRRLRETLVAGEFALSMILLIGAALLLQSFVKLRLVDPGFDPSHLLTMRMTLTGQRYQTAAQVAAFAAQLTGRVARAPGIVNVAMTNYLPLTQGMNIPLGSIVGRPNPDRKFLGNLEWFGVTPGFFDVMRIRIRSGRGVDDGDTAGSPHVVVVNEAFARKYLANEKSVGHRIVIAWDGLGPRYADEPREIVGVAGDIHEGSLNAAPAPAAFVPLTQVGDAVSALVNKIMPMNLLARTAGDPMSLSRAVMAEVRTADPMLPVYDIRPMDEVLGNSIQAQRFMTMLLGSFAALALALAGIGIYGVMSYAVAQKTREIGIRAALGAEPQDVMGMVMRQGLTLAAWGVIVGVAGAAALTRLLGSFLFGVTARDLPTFVGTPLLLTLVAVLACYVPARRALRVDPLTALRHE